MGFCSKPEYKEFITKSEHFKKVTADWDGNPGMHTPMTWGDTRAMGSISLALVPNGISREDIEGIKKNIIGQADLYLDLAHKEGYRLPFSVPKEGYPWGSTSFVLNNGLIMALAYDFTNDGKYLNGVALSMDYILGRNPLAFSYVSGYGTHAEIWYRNIRIRPLTKADALDPEPKVTEVWFPVPAKVTPGAAPGAPPSDAIVLFDGKNIDAWQSTKKPGVQKKRSRGTMLSIHRSGSQTEKRAWRMLPKAFRERTRSARGTAGADP